jgi:inorganic pyrophosphatase
MTVPPSNEPWKAFVELLRKFMKLIHDQVSNKIHISAWDPELEETEKRIKKPKDFPEGLPKKRKHFTNYFSGYLNPKKGKPLKCT